MTTTATATATTMDRATAKPATSEWKPKIANKGKMTASWVTRPSSQWSFHEKALVYLGISTPNNQENPMPAPPVYPMDAPVPVYPVWKMHAQIAPQALGPLLVHHFFTQLTGIEVPKWAAVVLYLAYFVSFGTRLFAWNNRMANKFGTFDGAAERDAVPDVDTTNTATGLFMVVISRSIVFISYLYNPSEPVLDLHTLLMLPVNCFVFAVAIDFYFYWYHRLMHEVPWLWQFHRKHHTTKHPTAALGAFADHEQEFFDMVGIPVLAWLTWRINFATWWVSTCYVLFIEASGHSGMRGYFQNPTTWFLRYFNAELCLEDHDIHHRQGWKKSGNYGKQTRLWDTIFGTKKPRIEGTPNNINWNDPMDEPAPVPAAKKKE